MGREYEVKFKATPQAHARLERELVGARAHYEMQTTYYDTPSQSLSDRWITLRCRRENEEYICTVKTPISDLGRGEWEAPCRDIRQAVGLLCDRGAPPQLAELCREGLVDVCGARFHRLAVTVEWEACVLEVALDSGVLMGGGRELPLCEVEVELKQGSEEALNLYARSLAALYGLTPEKKSKFRRALALYKGE